MEDSFSLPYSLPQNNMHAKESSFSVVFMAVHAVFLESGFVLSNCNPSCFTQESFLVDKTLSVQYTVPDLVASAHGRDEENVTLKFSVLGNFVLVFGFLNGDRNPSVCRVCFNLYKDLKLWWKIARDGLSFPLLIDICEKNRLPLPPCFVSLPADLIMKVLEILPGTDIAKVGCTCSQLRSVSSNNQLWRQKFKEELGFSKVVTRDWKARFATDWTAKREADRRRAQWGNTYFCPYGYYNPQRFPMLGEYYNPYHLYASQLPRTLRYYRYFAPVVMCGVASQQDYEYRLNYLYAHYTSEFL